MRDLAVLFLHLSATVARLAGPGCARAVMAESGLVRHGCPRIAQQIALAFGIPIDSDVVRRILEFSSFGSGVVTRHARHLRRTGGTRGT